MKPIALTCFSVVPQADLVFLLTSNKEIHAGIAPGEHFGGPSEACRPHSSASDKAATYSLSSVADLYVGVDVEHILSLAGEFLRQVGGKSNRPPYDGALYSSEEDLKFVPVSLFVENITPHTGFVLEREQIYSC
jgi:hypothetical protein